jgi:FKBP-type peptidyl-prolyl cis-trans isomerase
MNHRKKIRSASLQLIEPLEQRLLLSSTTKVHIALSTADSILGQDVTFTATVTNLQGGATPTGKVKFFDGSTLVGKVFLSTSGTAAFDDYTLFQGTHPITAQYKGNANFAASTSGTKTLTITRGTLTTESSGLKMETTAVGSGAAAAAGNFVEMEYAGYLTDGTKFDSSFNSDRTPFGFILDNTPEDVVPGFDQGATGMLVGETRLLIIPGALGYGASPPSGSVIPANAKLIFIIHLLAIVPTPGPALAASGLNSEPLTSSEPASPENGTNFGPISVGSSSTVLTFVLGSEDSHNQLSFSQTPAISVTGADPGDFILTQPASDPNNSSQVIFTLQFSPQATGVRKATIDVFTNDSTNPVFKIKVTGTGE